MEYFMKKFFRFIIPVLLFALILASVFWYCFIYDRNFTRDMLLTQARYHSTDGNPRIASWFYDMAYELSDQNDADMFCSGAVVNHGAKINGEIDAIGGIHNRD